MAGANGCGEAECLGSFHTQFNNADQVKKYMEINRFTEGQYLLRPSYSKKNRLAISVVVARGKICHLNVISDKTGVYLAPEKKFRSLEALIDHYSHNDISNNEQVKKVRLLNPIFHQKRGPLKHSRHSESSFPCRGSDASLNSSSGASAASGQATKKRSQSMGMILPPDVYLDMQQNSSPRFNPVLSPEIPNYLAPKIGMPGVPRPLPLSMRDRPLPQPPSVEESEHELDREPNYSHAQRYDVGHGRVRLNFANSKSENRCHCGLRADLVALPGGWSVHLSQPNEVNSLQCIFFQGPSNETALALPAEICDLLSDAQRATLKQLTNNYSNSIGLQ